MSDLKQIIFRIDSFNKNHIKWCFGNYLRVKMPPYLSIGLISFPGEIFRCSAYLSFAKMKCSDQRNNLNVSWTVKEPHAQKLTTHSSAYLLLLFKILPNCFTNRIWKHLAKAFDSNIHRIHDWIRIFQSRVIWQWFSWRTTDIWICTCDKIPHNVNTKNRYFYPL